MSYYYVYLLISSKTGKWYTGYTRNLRKRFNEHNSGMCNSTKHGRPWKLIYYEACLIKEDAIAREKYLKSGMGKRYLKNRLKCYVKDGHRVIF
jgi:putative endonuclease